VLTIILGFATSLVYGFADFFGALGSKRIQPVVVTFWSGLSGLGLLLIASLFMCADFSPAGIFWGVTAGVASAFAMSCLYASLAIGPISILSPLGAVVSAIVPMIVGSLQGDRFSLWGWVALAGILVAVVLVGFVPGEDVRLPSTKGLLLGLAAGAGIGLVLIALAKAPHDTGLTSVIFLRATSATLLGIFMVFSLIKAKRKNTSNQDASGERPVEASAAATAKAETKVPLAFWWAVIVAGFFDSSANVFFTLASRLGSLSVVAVLTALYPLGTIILARIFLKEKIAKTQLFGILLALAASALLAVA
jgi:drug/metabolite transporter (DMT)-like permease